MEKLACMLLALGIVLLYSGCVTGQEIDIECYIGDCPDGYMDFDRCRECGGLNCCAPPLRIFHFGPFS